MAVWEVRYLLKSGWLTTKQTVIISFCDFPGRIISSLNSKHYVIISHTISHLGVQLLPSLELSLKQHLLSSSSQCQYQRWYNKFVFGNKTKYLLILVKNSPQGLESQLTDQEYWFFNRRNGFQSPHLYGTSAPFVTSVPGVLMCMQAKYFCAQKLVKHEKYF